MGGGEWGGLSNAKTDGAAKQTSEEGSALKAREESFENELAARGGRERLIDVEMNAAMELQESVGGGGRKVRRGGGRGVNNGLSDWKQLRVLDKNASRLQLSTPTVGENPRYRDTM